MQAKQSDGNRREQILIGMAEGNHPLSQFSWGNNISLPITTPEQAARLQKNVRTFFESYYSSNLMTVCVSYVFTDDLDTLHSIVAMIHTDINNESLTADGSC